MRRLRFRLHLLFNCLYFLVFSVLVDELGVEILPYAVLLIVPLLGRMSDQLEDIRLLATQTFASLVKLMPLEVETNSSLIGVFSF